MPLTTRVIVQGRCMICSEWKPKKDVKEFEYNGKRVFACSQCRKEKREQSRILSPVNGGKEKNK